MKTIQEFIGEKLEGSPRELGDAESQEWIATAIQEASGFGKATHFYDGATAGIAETIDLLLKHLDELKIYDFPNDPDTMYLRRKDVFNLLRTFRGDTTSHTKPVE